ncbi:MAG: aminotransferase class V-fold PLP-dependent enzyme [Proteobacteria bacterium]|nr:aminotransferase class V-fold PLP-dependent enzyme [Pseudomonadota bacterium]
MVDFIRDLLKDNFPEKEEVESLRRKFFVGPGNDADFRKWGEIATELALDWLKNPEKRKIHADISLPELADLLGETDIPELGEQIEKVFRECREKILDNSVRINNPRYIGHMTTGVPWFSVVVDILITSINQNQVKIETALASSFVERQTLAWLHRLAYNDVPDFYHKVVQDETIALGNTTSGGTMGNLTALAVARGHVLPDIRKQGFVKALGMKGFSDIVVIASRRVHYSIEKAVGLLGLGEENVVKIPVDDYNKIRIDILRQEITRLKRDKVLIMALVGIAGTTETGNIDPLNELADIAAKEKIWFHVDAAWGGAMLLSPELKRVLKGIERSDSITLDGHKLFYLPMSHGAVVFRKPDALDALRHNANYILRKGSVDLGLTSLEGSRRFNALKLWFSIKMLGKKGYNVLFKKSLQLTLLLKHLIDEDEDFERTSEPEICIITYRFVPEKWQTRLKAARTTNDKKRQQEINRKFNAINIELQKRQREYGQSFVSRTTLESTGYQQEIVVLRAVLTNLLTESRCLAEILDEQRSIGREIIDEN